MPSLAGVIRRSSRAAKVAIGAARRRRIAAQLASFSRPFSLNVGCGDVRFQGFVGIDASRHARAVDVVWDATLSLPFPDLSCARIYSEHFLEHLSRDAGRDWLRDCHRVLMPEGTLRVAMPSLQYIVDKYRSAEWHAQAWLRQPEYAHIRTRAHMINLAFREWGHQWLYDEEELTDALHDAGFADITLCQRSESADPLLRNRETRADSLLICEARR